MKKILVTGGTGFLGKHVVSTLQKQSNKYAVHSCSRSEGIDIRNYPQFEKFITSLNPDYVVHCAAHVGGIAYNELHPVAIFEDNVTIGLNLIKACHQAKIKHLINIMPNCTYPGHMSTYKEEDWWNGPIHKTVLTYGLPRKMVWGSCFCYKWQYDFKSIHLIFSNMYGPHDHFDPVRSHALGALIKKILAAQTDNLATVDIWGTGQPVREWLYVKDAAESITKVLEKLEAFENNDIINIGIGKGISIADMANIIKEVVGWKGEFVFDSSKPDGAMQKILIVDKMRQLLDWAPPTNFRDGIEEAVKWYQENYRIQDSESRIK